MHKNLLQLLLVGATLILAGCSLPTGIASGLRDGLEAHLRGLPASNYSATYIAYNGDVRRMR
jgi:hypothetical protein